MNNHVLTVSNGTAIITAVKAKLDGISGSYSGTNSVTVSTGADLVNFINSVNNKDINQTISVIFTADIDTGGSALILNNVNGSGSITVDFAGFSINNSYLHPYIFVRNCNFFSFTFKNYGHQTGATLTGISAESGAVKIDNCNFPTFVNTLGNSELSGANLPAAVESRGGNIVINSVSSGEVTLKNESSRRSGTVFIKVIL
jgi:hypothetical protein